MTQSKKSQILNSSVEELNMSHNGQNSELSNKNNLNTSKKISTKEIFSSVNSDLSFCNT